MSPAACNFDPTATQNDGSCDFESCVGCGVPSACNYDPDVTVNIVFLCTFPPAGGIYNCAGQCNVDTDGDGVCNQNEVPGCTNPSSINYNPYATDNNGSCAVGGCTLPFACNYNPQATYLIFSQCVLQFPCPNNAPAGGPQIAFMSTLCTNPYACNYNQEGPCDFLSCLALGCTDNTACNFDPSALYNDGSCEYLSCVVPGCTISTACNFNPAATVNNGSCEYTSCVGCTDATASNYDPDATVDNGSCTFPGCIFPAACNFEPTANLNDGSCEYTSCAGCMNASACNYDASFTLSNPASCVFAVAPYDCEGDCVNDTDGDGVCNELEQPGCTTVGALNYSASATDDDGSCVFVTPGCVIPAACNYNPLANVNDGSCEFLSCTGCMNASACNFDSEAIYNDATQCVFPAQYYDCAGNCLSDSDSDGVCDQLDNCSNLSACNYAAAGNTACLFNDACGVCGGSGVDTDGDGTCDALEVEGCTDAGACNYDADATEENGSCDYCSCPETIANYEGYQVVVEPVTYHYYGALAGLTTYRLYLETPNADDIVTSFTGNSAFPLEISTSTSFYQHPGGGVTSASQTPFLLSNFPEAAYDSYVTINMTAPAVTAEGQIEVSIPPGNWMAGFEAGGSILVNDIVGSGWYVTPDASNALVVGNRMLFAQLTTDGAISGSFRAQVFPNGNGLADERVDLYFSQPACGCTDVLACNFSPNAEYDNGSCQYFVPGYDCAGNCLADSDEDGVCNEFEVVGCQDADACNYNAAATDASACTYPSQPYLDCAGECVSDVDGDGICDINEIAGCTDAMACNYSAAATDNDGSCTYQAAWYINCAGQCLFDFDGDGVCNQDEVLGCTVPTACNFNPAATENNFTCTFPAQPYLNCAGACLNDTDGDGICNEIEVAGCTDAEACNYNAAATDENGSCTYPATTYVDCDGTCLNDSDNDGVCDEIEVAGCTDGLACNFNDLATDEDGTCTYPAPLLDCEGACVNDADGDGICDELEIAGCQDPAACDYLPTATDGTECDYCSCQGNTTSIPGYGIVIDAVQEHVTGDLAGQTTYRVYLTTPNASDVLTAVTGNDEFSLALETTTSFYQHPAAGVTPAGLTPALLGIAPNAAYDSYVTIGLDGPASGAEMNVQVIPSPWTAAFENGNSFEVVDGIGSGWFVVPGAPNAIAGADHRILIAQLTTDGKVSGSFRAQVFPMGDPANDDRADITFLDGVCGCNDVTAFNYDPNADFNDGSCIEEFPGCMDATACNFQPYANIEDGSCTYAEANYDCDGDCLADADGDGICDLFEVVGCQDATACNYNPDATDADDCDYAAAGYGCDGNCLADTDNDGVCDLFEVEGCQDAAACNYNASATDAGDCTYAVEGYDCAGNCLADVDGDGVCDPFEVVGCQDASACNYDAAATDAGACDYAATGYDCAGNCLADADGDGICNPFEVVGCQDAAACNYDAAATDAGACTYAAAGYDCDGICLADADGDGVCDPFEVVGCQDAAACNYDSDATDSGACTYAASGYDCSGVCLADGDGDGVCDPFEVVGCQDAAACNYNADATDAGACNYATAGYDCSGVCLADADGDGVCDPFEVVGCQDPIACNYNADATDLGACTYAAPAYDCEGNCLADADGDGICDSFEVVGCLDPAGCNYNADATDAGVCDFVTCYGCTYPEATNYDPAVTFDNGTCAFAGCTNPSFANYNPFATVSDGSCTDAPISADFNGDGIVQNQDLLDFLLAYGQVAPLWGGQEWIQDACNIVAEPLENIYTEVDFCGGVDAPENCEDYGCTYPSASNYDADATIDGGNCVWTGCTDSEALNYNPIATLDDSTCNYQVCPDFNGDGQVQAQDLLNFLLAWGSVY